MWKGHVALLPSMGAAKGLLSPNPGSIQSPVSVGWHLTSSVVTSLGPGHHPLSPGRSEEPPDKSVSTGQPE